MRIMFFNNKVLSFWGSTTTGSTSKTNQEKSRPRGERLCSPLAAQRSIKFLSRGEIFFTGALGGPIVSDLMIFRIERLISSGRGAVT